MVTIDSTLADIMQLDFASREMLLQILQKCQVEARRDDIARSAKQSLKDYHSGNITPLTAGEIFEKLNQL